MQYELLRFAIESFVSNKQATTRPWTIIRRMTCSITIECCNELTGKHIFGRRLIRPCRHQRTQFQQRHIWPFGMCNVTLSVLDKCHHELAVVDYCHLAEPHLLDYEKSREAGEQAPPPRTCTDSLGWQIYESLNVSACMYERTVDNRLTTNRHQSLAKSAKSG